MAAAHMHEVLQHFSGEPAAERLQNILETAQTIVHLIRKPSSKRGADGCGDEDEGELKEADSADLTAAGPVQTPPAEPVATAAVPQASSQTVGKLLPVLQQLLKEIKQATPTLPPTPSSTLHAPSSRTTPSATSPTQAAASSTPADNGLPVATPLLHSIYSCLDSRSAAKAAASCKQLNSIHKLNRHATLPPTFQAYVAALEAINDPDDDELYASDGSLESAFVGQWPLDGSIVCGADLTDDAMRRQLQPMLPSLGDMLASLTGMGAGPARTQVDMIKHVLDMHPAADRWVFRLKRIEGYGG
jgi:hypothetical protein